MPETETGKEKRQIRIRHKGRASQVQIYLGKQFRFFINQNDWKVLPMAAIIAGLVGMVIRRRMFINMEGSLIGAFALVCMGLWNGCFNSIQTICRERPIIKREHRSGMHISSYVCAHMIYQLILCAAQTGLSVYVLMVTGVQFPAKGFMTPWMIVDVGITLLLITYASDMMSLFLSSLAHTTTSAMTVMPFVLIFQLIFSGGIIPLPEWSQPLTKFTITNYGIRAVAAQTGYNEMPMVTGWNTLNGMRNREIGGTYSVGQVLDLLDSPFVEKNRDRVVIKTFTVGEILEALNVSTDALSDEERERGLNEPLTVGRIADWMKGSKIIQSGREKTFTLKTTVGELIDLLGEEEVRTLVQRESAKAAYKPEYESTTENVVRNWMMLIAFIFGFALLAVISLELIDRDKR